MSQLVGLRALAALATHGAASVAAATAVAVGYAQLLGHEVPVRCERVQRRFTGLSDKLRSVDGVQQLHDALDHLAACPLPAMPQTSLLPALADAASIESWLSTQPSTDAHTLLPPSLEYVRKLSEASSKVRQGMDAAMVGLSAVTGVGTSVSPNSYAASAFLTRTMPAVHTIRMLIQHGGHLCELANPEVRMLGAMAVGEHRLHDLVSQAWEDVSSLALEKHGVVTDVKIVAGQTQSGETDGTDGQDGTRLDNRDGVVCLPSHLNFVCIELLKNATGTCYSRHGVDADFAPPIRVETHVDDDMACLVFSDHGQAVPFANRERVLDFFFSTVEQAEPTYTFSGNFGGQLEGRGVGLPVARSYARLLGGDIAVCPRPGRGTDVCVWVRRFPTV
eukprot:m.194971 g.194971  ORF g.194971 m.194971 type:complete len:391 (-) comp18305_c0_seq2:106-1278(-)